MGNQSAAGEAALVRAVRALDQGDVETIPDRLEKVWDILENYHGGSFHAAEEMLLRWLLKNMTGSSANAERVRRYARAWDILAAIFGLIPLFSLAKSLADRRFVSILQQTLKDVAAPQQEETRVDGNDSDVDMVDAPTPESPTNPRKRKRAGAAGFDVASQKRAAGCLQTAEAIFEAIGILLSRCELKSQQDGSATHRMGAEHVKSLFSTSATETMGTLVPWLAICGLALERPKVEPLREQFSWLSTFAALWELHLQGATDASEVATHLSGTAIRLLGKLAGIPQQMPLGIEVAVQGRWAQDLRRFLARNLILPARAVFLTKGSQDIVKVAVDMSSASAQITFPVLFDLVSKSPLEIGGKTSRKDYETWVQAVFDTIMHASKNLGRENKTVAVRTAMEIAADRGTALSAASLRAVCNDYALRTDAYDWGLLLAAVKLNPDVFLVTEEGKQLLEKILEKTKHSDSLGDDDSKKAAQFIVLLADGYAQARDLSTFARVWLKHLAPAKPKAGLQPLWAQKELGDTVAKLLQSSLNSTQLVETLEWLSSQTEPAESIARIHILEAISGGITQEEFVDATNIKIFQGAFLEKPSKKDLPAISACRWMVASKAIARGTLEEADQIWSQIKSDVKSALRKSPIDRGNAASLICSFVERIDESGEPMELDSDTSESSGMSFSHLESIGRCLLTKRSNRRSRGGLPKDDTPGDRDNLKLLQQLAVLDIRQMTSGSPEEREKTYLKDAISLLQSPCQDSGTAPRLVLLQAFISTVQTSSILKKLEDDGLDLGSLKAQLLQVASPAVTAEKRTGKGLLALLVALEAFNELDRQAVKQALSSAVPSLLEASDSLLENGLQAGWEVRMFVSNHFPEALGSPLKIKMSVESSPSREKDEEETEGSESAATLGKRSLLGYVDAVVQSADEDTKLGYLKELLLEDGEDQDMLGRQLVIYRLIQHLKGSLPVHVYGTMLTIPGSGPSESPDRFDLAQAHSTLCSRLVRTSTAPHFLLAAKAIHLLLDQNPACMTQWNIELTLSTVSTLSAQPSTQALISDSPRIYPSLCRLVEMVIKRHRKRLDGHFHILITTLQSLLHLLLSRPPHPTTHHQTEPTTNPSTPTSHNHTQQWEAHAKLFTRLLTLLCSPTAASVSRGGSQKPTGLDSERDRAKRYAGQFMPLVLMGYVRLQLRLAHPVPHGVREALAPGLYAILDITSPDGLRVLNDGLDGSGRVVFREMYRLYQRFGKWSGV
ncbi:Urb2/Npa2 family-domain-containing protein [Chaetomium fimeti]|uniref:Urb2/Npa2 family-domain-containing protein n=1 Tax=Chaetomium fimeti TaxID=1854472 RepID=A0AAE0HFB4_9PEZI|nr:Urb2/Npa2 family-domain-containing protein [Chaetomium fimeti]